MSDLIVLVGDLVALVETAETRSGFLHRCGGVIPKSECPRCQYQAERLSVLERAEAALSAWKGNEEPVK